jgi:hypothetical protein
MSLKDFLKDPVIKIMVGIFCTVIASWIAFVFLTKDTTPTTPAKTHEEHIAELSFDLQVPLKSK